MSDEELDARDEARKPLTQARLDALCVSVPHAELADVADVKPGMDEEPLADLNVYFASFAKPTMKNGVLPCIQCDEPLTGGIASMFGRGGFVWGIAHGHGHCRNCHYPAVAHHFIKDRHGAELATIRNLILQVHPDNLELRQPERAP